MNIAYAEDRASVDQRTARWLKKRHPRWDAQRINRLIARTRVIDDHPNWTDAEVDEEVAERHRDREALA